MKLTLLGIPVRGRRCSQPGGIQERSEGLALASLFIGLQDHLFQSVNFHSEIISGAFHLLSMSRIVPSHPAWATIEVSQSHRCTGLVTATDHWCLFPFGRSFGNCFSASSHCTCIMGIVFPQNSLFLFPWVSRFSSGPGWGCNPHRWPLCRRLVRALTGIKAAR